MSYLLPHLDSGWAVDQAILAEEDRLVVLRFGHDYDPTCMQMDEVLYAIAELVKNYSVIYLVDTTEVPDFNTMYELYDPCTVMFLFRNKVCHGPGPHYAHPPRRALTRAVRVVCSLGRSTS